MHAIAVNARFYSHRITGMQRYAIELSNRFSGRVDLIRPNRSMQGIKGHVWEQTYLPFVSGRRLLWSPNNTGPVTVQRQICTMHDLIPLDHPEWFNPRFSTWYRWLLPRLARRVSFIIAISEFTRVRVLELLRVSPERVAVVPNGVDPRFQPQAVEAVAGAREALKLPDKPYVLCLGSLEPRKNLSTLLKAWAILQARFRGDVQLVVAGASANPSVFARSERCLHADNVFFAGYVPDEALPALYSGALGMVYPSLYEGFGLPPLEAMACGCPVITSETTSLPEVVGDAALLIDPLDPESIAEAIRRVVEDAELREAMRAGGLRQASRFSWDRCAHSTWKILERSAAN
jgi:glycosyltransferase involved in cell wall biosynthesis